MTKRKRTRKKETPMATVVKRNPLVRREWIA